MDYFFVSRAEFEAWIEGNALLEHAVVYGDYKGIPRQQVRRWIVATPDAPCAPPGMPAMLEVADGPQLSPPSFFRL